MKNNENVRRKTEVTPCQSTIYNDQHLIKNRTNPGHFERLRIQISE